VYPTLETERLLLKPLQESDSKDMFELFSNSTVTATMEGMEGKTMSLTMFRKWFSDVVNIDSFYTIRCKETSNFFGYCQIHPCIKQNKVSHSQMNIALLPDFWGKGYATEATLKLLYFAFLGIKTPLVYANQFPENLTAGSVLKKCGLRFYKTFKMQNRLHNQYRYKIDEYLTDNNLLLEKDGDYVLPIMKSPYSYNHPIRKIDSITFIEQPTEYLCGQSVVAMLAGVSVDEVIGVMQTDQGTSTPEIRDALKWYGLKTATKTRIKYTPGMVLPDCCILSILLPGYGHWSLYYKGKFYDPEFGVLDKLPEQAKLRYYWEVVI